MSGAASSELEATQRGFDESDEPTALGAAATVSARDRPTLSRAERRRVRRETRAIGEAPAAESGIVHVFEPHSAKVPPLGPYLDSLWRRRRLIAALAKGKLRGSRSSTALGSIWGLLDPMFQSAIYFFLFVVIRGGEGRPVTFLPLLIAGIFLFKLCSQALNQGGKSVRGASNLMLSSSFPRAVLPISEVYKGILGFIPTTAVYVLVYAWLGEPPQPELLWLPLIFLLLCVMNLGVALLMSTIVVFFKDAENALVYVQRIIFFTTPIIYPVAILPEGMRSVLVFQPYFPAFAVVQQALSGGPVEMNLVIAAAAWAVVLLLVGSWLFLRYEQAMSSRV